MPALADNLGAERSANPFVEEGRAFFDKQKREGPRAFPFCFCLCLGPAYCCMALRILMIWQTDSILVLRDSGL